MYGCLDCGKRLEKTTRDHLYGYDHGKKVLLREVEIPKMGPLHEAISQALSVLRVRRDNLAFVFTPGDHGVRDVRDGAWGVMVRGA